MEAHESGSAEHRARRVLEGPLAIAVITLGVVAGAAGNFLVIAIFAAVALTVAMAVRIWAVDRDRRPAVPAWSLAVAGLAAVGFGLIRGFGLVFGLLALLVVVVGFVILGGDIA